MSLLSFLTADSALSSADNPSILDYETCEESSPEFEWEFDGPGKEDIKISDYINNLDYTLNSPLIKDSLDNFVSFLKDGYVNPLFKRPKWETSKRWFYSRCDDLINLKDSRFFHPWVGKLYRSSPDTRGFDTMLSETDEDAEVTFSVLKSFLKGWLGKNFTYQSRLDLSYHAKKYGQMMLDLTKIVWCMNSSGSIEFESLKEILPLLDIQTSEQIFQCVLETESFGVVIISGEFLILVEENLILDRNMALMVKDTALARFQSLMNIQYRATNDYAVNHLREINRLYDLGDIILERYGVKAYKSIKLIEALSSQRLSEIASDTRPEIPRFTTFKEHIDKTILDLSTECPEISQFSQFVLSLDDIKILATVYGSFRHWGHPFIDYLGGLEALHHNVTMEKEIDDDYAQQLGSDLAFKVLRNQFFSKRKWFVDKKQFKADHILYPYILRNEWPPANVIQDMGDTWHTLPLMKCFDIPDTVDPSLIYADKSHSLTRSELINFLQSNPHKPIPSPKVLETLLKEPATDWPTFLKKVNDEGLSPDNLIIGLKGKEREMKELGRFFALMSWQMREYFVFTEYLIKTHFVPLFDGLTMADDQVTVIKKLLQSSGGQDLFDYIEIGIANHLDYQKWNNHQRFQATYYVFLVMGMFLGYPFLITRTHEMFQKSFIYYKDRPDLMEVIDGTIRNICELLVCWDGQEGGLEGLRQKGWSVLNLLIIEREARVRNTLVKTLAQGDNQVVCTQYKVRVGLTIGERSQHIQEIIRNNNVIMDLIRKGTKRLGLVINNDETLQSADMLIYGKVIIFKGSVLCLEEKRYSRVSCTTNDQLPGLGNTLSSASTNTLTVAHYSTSPLNAMFQYNWLSNWIRNMLMIHNPALKRCPRKIVRDPKSLKKPSFLIAFSYLDPILGGIGGMSLTRFLIRRFPDPVTESLSFWKLVYNNSDDRELQKICIEIGNPSLRPFSLEQLTKLIEDPTCLNVPKGVKASNVLKEEIKKGLMRSYEKIGHEFIRQSLFNSIIESDALNNYLLSIEPCFPRFISEFRSATYCGLTDSLIGLFANSRTIRNVMRTYYSTRIDGVIVKSEIQCIESLIKFQVRIKKSRGVMWDCSSSHADQLRLLSWGRKCVGTTIPHPLEMIKKVSGLDSFCQLCNQGGNNPPHIIVLIPQGLPSWDMRKGPYPPYLGSTTSETTSLIQPWEKETKIPFIRRATELRNAITWFVDSGSRLAESILNNLEALTGEKVDSVNKGYKRTGSAIHRFSCSRQSGGGYSAQNPTKGTWMVVSTDTLGFLNHSNYDFMFQALILYSQITAGELVQPGSDPQSIHFHLTCDMCLREIDEPILDSLNSFEFRDVSGFLQNWKPPNIPWFQTQRLIEIPYGDWDSMSHSLKSYHIGRTQGFYYGDYKPGGFRTGVNEKLFPLTLRDHLIPNAYLEGVSDGLFRAGASNSLHRSGSTSKKKRWLDLKGVYCWYVKLLCAEPDFINMINTEAFFNVVTSIPHKIPPSYPANRHDLGLIVSNYLLTHFNKSFSIPNRYLPLDKRIWIFADFSSSSMIGVFALTSLILEKISSKRDNKRSRNLFKTLSNAIPDIREGQLSVTSIKGLKMDKVFLHSSEVRHCSKDLPKVIPDLEIDSGVRFEPEITGEIYQAKVLYTTEERLLSSIMVPHVQNPLIAGMRLPQLATSAYLKLNCIFNHVDLHVLDAICGGDGSGGMGALILRRFATAKLIFNSLLDLSDVTLKGTLPSPPNAITALPYFYRSRCVNLHSAWELPSDLTLDSTWRGFSQLVHQHSLKINLIVLDMECLTGDKSEKVEQATADNVLNILNPRGTLIFKTYMDRLLNHRGGPLKTIGSLFSQVSVCQTEFSGSQTSEIYLICSGQRDYETKNLYPDIQDLYLKLNHSFCFKSLRQEFNRALSLKKKPFLKGIPPTLISSPELDMLGILGSMGFHTQFALDWSHRLVSVNRMASLSYTESLIALLGLSLNHKIQNDFTETLVPSDPRIVNIISGIIGLWLWISLVTERFILSERCQFTLDYGVNFYYRCSKENGRDKIVWSTQVRYEKLKALRLNSRMGLVSSMIRTMGKAYGFFVPKTVTATESLLRTYNPKITKKLVRKITGALDWDSEDYEFIKNETQCERHDEDFNRGTFEPVDQQDILPSF